MSGRATDPLPALHGLAGLGGWVKSVDPPLFGAETQVQPVVAGGIIVVESLGSHGAYSSFSLGIPPICHISHNLT